MNDNLDKIREHRKKCHYAIYLMTHASINSRRVNCFVHEVRPGDLSLLWRRGGQGALTLLSNQRFMDVRDNTSTSNGRLDQSIQLFISSNRELKMSGRNTLDFEILGRISCQLQNLSSEVFQDGRAVHSCRSTNPT